MKVARSASETDQLEIEEGDGRYIYWVQFSIDKHLSRLSTPPRSSVPSHRTSHFSYYSSCRLRITGTHSARCCEDGTLSKDLPKLRLLVLGIHWREPLAHVVLDDHGLGGFRSTLPFPVTQRHLAL